MRKRVQQGGPAGAVGSPADRRRIAAIYFGALKKKKKKKKIAPSGKKAGMDRFYFRIKGNLFFRKPRMNI